MNDFFAPFQTFSNTIFVRHKNKDYSYEEFFGCVKLKAIHLLSNPKNLNSNIIALEYNEDFDFLLNTFAVWYIGKTALLISKDHQHIQKEILTAAGTKLNPIDTFEQIKNDATFDCPKSKLSEKAVILLTSGSEGFPKLVVHSFDALKLSAHSSIKFYNMIKGETSFLTIAPHHIGGLMSVLRAYFSAGIIITKVKTWKDYIENHADYISLVPKQLSDILKDPAAINILKQSKAIIMGGSRLSEDIYMQAKEKGLKISLSYGQTETCAQVIASAPDSKSFHLGKSLLNKRLLLDCEKRISIEGPCLYIGIMKRGEFVARQKGPYQTQDVATLNLNNEIISIERTDQIINSGGKKISPFEIKNFIVENTTLSDDDVEIYKIFDKKWGEVPIAAIRSTNVHLLDKLKVATFPKFKRPKHYLYLDQFPYKNLKVNRTYLRRQVLIDFLRTHSEFDFSYQQSSNSELKPLVIFIHGFMGDSNDHFFDNSIYDILSLNLPGHGKTNYHNFKSFKDVASKLSELLSILSQEKMLIYGYSLGGRMLLSSLSQLQAFSHLHQYVFESAHIGLISKDMKYDRLVKDKELSLMLLALDSIYDYQLFLEKWYDRDVFCNIKQSKNYKGLIKNKIQTLSIDQIHRFAKGLSLMSLAHQENCRKHITGKNKHFIIGDLDRLFVELYESESLLNVYKVDHASHNVHLDHAEKISNLLQSYQLIH
ncbi:MAG: AMP-binding protein [Bacteriovoracaceae bacterium]|jgi:o-succinylbenzoate---CoA ligase|nr:AMP-binding protein [Bacteriovoracaceae bacterium]